MILALTCAQPYCLLCNPGRRPLGSDGWRNGPITVAQPLKGFDKFLNMLELWVLIKILICMLEIY